MICYKLLKEVKDQMVVSDGGKNYLVRVDTRKISKDVFTKFQCIRNLETQREISLVNELVLVEIKGSYANLLDFPNIKYTEDKDTFSIDKDTHFPPKQILGSPSSLVFLTEMVGYKTGKLSKGPKVDEWYLTNPTILVDVEQSKAFLEYEGISPSLELLSDRKDIFIVYVVEEGEAVIHFLLDMEGDIILNYAERGLVHSSTINSQLKFEFDQEGGIMDPSTEAVEEINQSIKDRLEFEEACKPLMKYLAKNYYPHIKVIIDANSAELLEGERCFRTDEFLVD